MRQPETTTRDTPIRICYTTPDTGSPTPPRIPSRRRSRPLHGGNTCRASIKSWSNSNATSSSTPTTSPSRTDDDEATLHLPRLPRFRLGRVTLPAGIYFPCRFALTPAAGLRRGHSLADGQRDDGAREIFTPKGLYPTARVSEAQPWVWREIYPQTLEGFHKMRTPKIIVLHGVEITRRVVFVEPFRLPAKRLSRRRALRSCSQSVFRDDEPFRRDPQAARRGDEPLGRRGEASVTTTNPSPAVARCPSA